jgi:hypothetical protein
VKSPPPDVEIYTFANGSGIGIFYIDPAQALTPVQYMNAIWLEFEVDRRRPPLRYDWRKHAPVRTLEEPVAEIISALIHFLGPERKRVWLIHQSCAPSSPSKRDWPALSKSLSGETILD